jgi:hypothetical protein
MSEDDEKAPEKPNGDDAREAAKAAWREKKAALVAEREKKKPERDAARAARQEKLNTARAERQNDPERAAKLEAWRERKAAVAAKSAKEPAEGAGKVAWLEKRDAVRAERKSTKPAREKTSAEKPAKGAGKAAWLEQRDAVRAERQSSKPVREKKPADKPAEGAGKAAWREKRDAVRVERQSDPKRAAQIASRREKKGTAETQGDDAKPDAAKAERKAARQQAKERKKSGRKTLKTPQAETAKAERKATKQQAKERKTSEPDAAGTPEAEAAKAERKATRQQAKDSKKSERETAKTPESEAAKAERKAARSAAKAERKSAAAETGPDDAAKAERKAAKQQAKGRKAKKAQSTSGLSKEERKQAKREAKAAKKTARSGQDGGEDRPVRLSVVGPEAEALQAALTDAFRTAGAETEAAEGGKADLIVHTFENTDAGEIARRAAKIAGERARVHILVERADGAGDVNRAIARLAAAVGGALVSVPSQLERYGTDDARALIVRSVVGIASAQLKHGVAPPAVEAADLAEARALAAQPAEFLAKLRWGNPVPPKAIWTQISQEQTEALADSKIMLSEERALAIEAKVDWSVEPDDKKARFVFYSLDFLTGPLAYWFAKVNGQNNEKIAAIDAALKERGTTPNALFVRATQIILDFLDKHPRAKGGIAWNDQPVIRRARVLALYVLCCRAALKRQIKFNDAAATAIIRALLDHAEALRADDFYAPCSMDGIEQDSLLVGLALVLRGTPYGNRLMEEAFGRLKRLQLDAGLSAEGVWMGDSFTVHCTVLASLTGLFNDFSPSDTALLEPLATTAKKMTAFAEAMLKSNGQPPAIDGSRERSYVDRLSGARKTIARAGGKPIAPGKIVLRNRITDTYVFREARYFISHSAQKVEEDSSLVILHAAPLSIPREDPGGIALAFAHGEANLIVRTEPEEEDGGAFDPALRNFYRVNGAGNLPPGDERAKSARMVKSWRGTGWAAAKGIEDSFDGAVIARTVVHMKAAHALIVVDELVGEGGATTFEQSWNIAPEFKMPAPAGEANHFASEGKGVLAVVLAGGGQVAIDAREGGAHVRRTLRLGRGVAATLFQWTDEPAEAALAIERDTVENWALAASGKGFSVRLELSDGELRCEPSA